MSFNPRSTDDSWPQPLLCQQPLRNSEGGMRDVQDVSEQALKRLKEEKMYKYHILIGHYMVFNMDAPMFEEFLSDKGLSREDIRIITEQCQAWCEYNL